MIRTADFNFGFKGLLLTPSLEWNFAVSTVDASRIPPNSNAKPLSTTSHYASSVEGRVSSLYQDLPSINSAVALLIAHTHSQMDTDLSISLIPDLPPKREGRATPN